MLGWLKKKKPEPPPPPAPWGKSQFVSYVAPANLTNKKVGDVTKIVIHRCSLWHWKRPIPDGDLCASLMQEAFTTDKELGSGMAVPYHVLVRVSGLVEQMLPLASKGAHAAKHNADSIAVCVVGSLSEAPVWQMESLARAVAILSLYAPSAAIVGHSDLPGGSADPAKLCPHPVVDLKKLNEMVYSLRPADLDSWSTERRMEAVRAAGFEI
jgi:hypothetical protein